MPDMCNSSDSEAEIRDVLSVPAQFSIAPSGSLSIAALLLLELPTVLDDTGFIFKFSKELPMLQLPTDLVSWHPLHKQLMLSSMLVMLPCMLFYSTFASGELSAPDGYNADELGNLLAHNESKSYERVLDDNSVVTTDGLKKIEGEGRSNRRRIANTQYKDFWQH
ncbi:hypothetical protein M405DRAFT_936657 [Rhizopogon salebrosus TDB-379]|nr:hypothetical protein M405DRAFT_936657 [Rhizopogon salebrosus TDB-379]